MYISIQKILFYFSLQSWREGEENGSCCALIECLLLDGLEEPMVESLIPVCV